MIGKTIRTQSIKPGLRYAGQTRTGGSGYTIGGNLLPTGINLASLEPDEQKRLLDGAEAMMSAQQIPGERKLEHPINHTILSLNPNDDISDQDFKRLTDDYLASMILTGDDPTLLNNPDDLRARRKKFITEELPYYQYSVTRHFDKNHSHVHVHLGRRNIKTGTLISTDFENYRSIENCKRLAQEYNLTPAIAPELNHQHTRDKNGAILLDSLRTVWARFEQQNNDLEANPYEGKTYKLRKFSTDNYGNPTRLNIYKLTTDSGTQRYSKRPAITIYADPNANNGLGYKNYSFTQQQAQELDRQLRERLKLKTKSKSRNIER